MRRVRAELGEARGASDLTLPIKKNSQNPYKQSLVRELHVKKRSSVNSEEYDLLYEPSQRQHGRLSAAGIKLDF